MDLRSMLKHIKTGLCLPPELKNNGSFTGNTYFDTLGLSGVIFLIGTGVTDAAIGSTAESTPPLVEECDTTNGSYTAVTSAAMAAVIPATASKMNGIFVDLTKKHKRYMQVQAPHSANGTTGANLCIMAIGFPSSQMPNSAAEMGLVEFIEA